MRREGFEYIFISLHFTQACHTQPRESAVQLEQVRYQVEQVRCQERKHNGVAGNKNQAGNIFTARRGHAHIAHTTREPIRQQVHENRHKNATLASKQTQPLGLQNTHAHTPLHTLQLTQRGPKQGCPARGRPRLAFARKGNRRACRTRAPHPTHVYYEALARS